MQQLEVFQGSSDIACLPGVRKPTHYLAALNVLLLLGVYHNDNARPCYQRPTLLMLDFLFMRHNVMEGTGGWTITACLEKRLPTTVRCNGIRYTLFAGPSHLYGCVYLYLQAHLCNVSDGSLSKRLPGHPRGVRVQAKASEGSVDLIKVVVTNKD